MLFKEKYLKAFNEVNLVVPAEEEVFRLNQMMRCRFNIGMR